MEDDAQRRLDDLRNRIVGLLQHEFRTPLTLVLGYAELIASTTPTSLNWDELRLSAAAILDGGRRLQALIESFLLLAALQNRTLRPGDLQYLEAGQIWEDIMQEVATTADAPTFRFDLQRPQPGVYVSGDEHLIKESLRRLLDNVLHCGHSASCRVLLSVVTLTPYVGLRLEGEGCTFCELAPPEILYPAMQPGSEELSGAHAGVSLMLVGQVARMHGGQLQVESSNSKAGAFTLWLPAAAPTCAC
jgi:signal transduction histidine kinase